MILDEYECDAAVWLAICGMIAGVFGGFASDVWSTILLNLGLAISWIYALVK
jgi:hypothetical protein